MLARTCTQGALGWAIAQHTVPVSWDGGPNGNGAGRTRRSGADETAEQKDGGSNPAPQEILVSLQQASE